ncbi:MAG: nucleotidyltransferase family protein, partial [Chlamydiota bacterium]
TALWENHEVATFEPLPGVLARRRLHWACGLIFPALAPEDRFIHQCVHLLSHTLQFWIRLAWLYELAGFLAGAQTNAPFWQSVEERIGGADCIAKAVRLATLLAVCVFGGQAPRFQMDDYRSLALWVREYGGKWAMYGLPGSKLSLFLFREFTDEQRWRRLEQRRLFPLHRPPAVTQTSFWHPRRTLRSHFAECRYAGRRFMFHIRETWRYLRERSHWQRRLLTLQQAVPPRQVETVSR